LKPSLGLVFDRVRWDEKALVRKARSKGVDLKILDAKTLCLDLQESGERIKDQFGSVVLQRCISHFRGFHLTAFLESKGVRVINSFAVADICGNKLFTTLALQKAGVPTPKTTLAFTHKAALEAIQKVGYPAVLKPVTGSWGRMVVRVKDLESAEALLEMREQFSNPLYQIYYVQEMVPRPPRDIRTIVIGERVATAVYRYSPPDDWRTNVAVGGRTEPCPLTKELEDTVLKASTAVGGGVLGVDVMEAPNGIVVHEVNSTVEFRGASRASKADIPGLIIDYAIEQVRS